MNFNLFSANQARVWFVLVTLCLFLWLGFSWRHNAQAQAGMTLQILHASDLEGGVDAIGDAPNFAAVVSALEADAASNDMGSITLSAGDNYLTGPFFSASGDGDVRAPLQTAHDQLFGLSAGSMSNIREGIGRIDITIMNMIGFDASALGNHEFDVGTNTIGDIIGTDIRGTTLDDVRWLGAQFPYLSANLDFSNDGNLSDLYTSNILTSTAFQSLPGDLDAAGMAPKLAPATLIEVNGELIGVVGATTPLLGTISSPGDTAVLASGNNMPALAAILNPTIAQIATQTDKIILVSHLQQLALEQELSGLLNGVDVIIAGGSDSLLADSTDRLRVGDVADETYPVQSVNADNDPVMIVSTDGTYSYVGRLVVEFDANGVIVPASLDEAVSGPYATDEQGVADLYGGDAATAFVAGTTAAQVRDLTAVVSGIVTSKDSQIYGKSDVYLEGRRAAVRTEETNLGNLSADANLAAAQAISPSVQVSIKNAGGIRGEMGTIDGITGALLPTSANPDANKMAGDISQLDIENTLRFNNELTVMGVSAENLHTILEHAVSAVAPGSTPGQFPQVGGLSFSFDPTATALGIEAGVVVTPGERIRNMAIIDSDGAVVDVIVKDGVIEGDATRMIEIVTLNFLAGGGDGYPFDIFGQGILETGIGEQQAFSDFMTANYATTPFNMADTPATRDTRIQNLSVRNDEVLGTTIYLPILMHNPSE